MSEHPKAPLSGLKVIESSLLGPAAITTPFVDMGAEVIKVEAPAGDYIREMTYRGHLVDALSPEPGQKEHHPGPA